MRKLNIRQKLRLLVLAGGLLGFTFFGILSLSHVWDLWKAIDERSVILGERFGIRVGYFVNKEEKDRLMEMSRLRAGLMAYDLKSIQSELSYMARKLSEILQSPQNYKPRVLPNAVYENVHGGMPYVHFAPELVAHGADDNLLAEIHLVSNIADGVVSFVYRHINYYPCVFVGSRKGYIIRADAIADDKLVPLARSAWRFSYDPRNRDWYIAGKESKEPVFTDVYYSTSGTPCFSCAVSYEDAEGFAGVVGCDINMQGVNELLKRTSFSDKSVSLVLGAKGEVLASNQTEGLLSFVDIYSDLRKAKGEPELAAIAERMVKGEEGFSIFKMDGKEYCIAFSPIEETGWSFATLIARDDLMRPAVKALQKSTEQMEKFRRSLAMNLLGFLVCSAVFVGLLLRIPYVVSEKVAKDFSEPITKLEEGVQEISKGNLEESIDIRTGDEFEYLAACFNVMAHDLKVYMENLAIVTAEKEQTAAELNVATNIQHDMLPNIFPPFPNRHEIDLYAVMHPAKEVGGDFYDFYFINENRVVITIADVSDKGVPAALFMVISKTLLKNFLMMEKEDNDLTRAVESANDQLCQSNKEDMFVTVFTGVLDVKTGKFSYINAGHNPPLVRHGQEGFSYLPSVKKSPMLGVMPGISFAKQTIQLSPGDTVFLYTDGVTEAMDTEKNMFTEKGLKDALNKQPPEIKAEELIANMENAIRRHVKNAEQSDDITMLTLKFLG